jgi:L-amino acid N-acyltransferase YncA
VPDPISCPFLASARAFDGLDCAKEKQRSCPWALDTAHRKILAVNRETLRMPVLRPSTDADLEAITAIYDFNVRHGTGSFEEVSPSLDEMARRRADVLDKGLPYMVAEREGRVVGYAYVNLYRPRSAYRFSLEDSIYTAPEAAGHGIGTALLTDLITQSTALGYRQMVAVIGDSANQGLSCTWFRGHPV